jgi:hypothetical protein
MIRRFALTLALGLVIAAVVAPAALAKPVGSDVANGGYDPWAYGLIYKSTHPSTTQVNLGPLDPWAYALVHKTSAPAVITTSNSSGFDFGDAGIGAAVSFGVALILLGTITVGIKYRRSDRSGLATS